jgi:mitochondrial division protein 1
MFWAAAQASATIGSGDSGWKPTGRTASRAADFVGSLQVFESALACGTADGMVRLWDLRSGQVHRSLVGHTGAVTCLQFDDVHLITGSVDRSIRVGSQVFFNATLRLTQRSDMGPSNRVNIRRLRL